MRGFVGNAPFSSGKKGTTYSISARKKWPNQGAACCAAILLGCRTPPYTPGLRFTKMGLSRPILGGKTRPNSSYLLRTGTKPTKRLELAGDTGLL